ncbi:large subunit ribosomal protein L29e [Pancytospora philotis]|nr:large subunit ribosomal protein L29e [Pancytospora philotis]
MAKRTHHTNCNQSRKNHKNGIKKPKQHKLIDTPGINDKLLRNLHYSKLGNARAAE